MSISFFYSKYLAELTKQDSEKGLPNNTGNIMELSLNRDFILDFEWFIQSQKLCQVLFSDGIWKLKLATDNLNKPVTVSVYTSSINPKERFWLDSNRGKDRKELNYRIGHTFNNLATTA